MEPAEKDAVNEEICGDGRTGTGMAGHGTAAIMPAPDVILKGPEQQVYYYGELSSDKMTAMNDRRASVRTLDELKRLIVPLVSAYDVDRVYIFGSYARGEADEKSDVDIRIDADRLCAFDLCGLMARLERALNTQVDVIPTDPMSTEFLGSIRDEEVMIYERSETGL